MKKILFGCIALSVLITAVAVVELNKEATPAMSPTEPSLNSNTKNETNVQSELTEEKTYTESEDQIQQAFENYIYFKGMDKKIKTDVRSDGRDFIITITNPSDATVPAQEVRLTRIEDFAGKPQYKITNTSLIKWQSIGENYFDNASIMADSFSEDIVWVPDLELLTNQATKAVNVELNADNLKANVKSLTTDMMVKEQSDKMDIATMADISDIKIATPGFVIQAPSVKQSMQIVNAEQTGNLILQLLTAQSATTSLNVPILGIASNTLGGQPILAQLDSKATFTDNITLDTTLSNIKITKNPLPMLPETITSNVTLEGVSKEILIAYVNMHEQLKQMPDEESTEGKELAQKLLAAQNQILKSLYLKINKLSLTNQNAAIDITGIVHYAEPAPTINARMAISNFDIISPKAPPVDETACKAAMAATPAPVSGQAPIIPAACVQQAGLLEGLRPYLESAEHTINEKGQPVDTFSIVYSAGSLTINNQPLLIPGQEVAKAGNELQLGTDTPAQTVASPTNSNSVSPQQEMPDATQTMPQEKNQPDFANTNTESQPSVDTVLQAQSIEKSSVSSDGVSIADLMAEAETESVTGPQGNAAPLVADEQIAIAAEQVAQMPEPAEGSAQPTDPMSTNTPAQDNTDILLQEVDILSEQDVSDTPLEEIQPSNTINTPAPLPTAPVIDSADIVEAQKLLDTAE